MARVIANNVTKVYFGTVANVQTGATRSEINAAVDLTGFLTSFDNSVEGNEVDTPNFEDAFESSIPGTYSASVSAEFYRDDTNDLAWDTLPRATSGSFIIQRFGDVPGGPQEVYPVRITSRSPVALANNESQRFNIDAAVHSPPNEDDTVPALV